MFLVWISLPVTNDKLRNSNEGQNSFRLDVCLSRLSLMTGIQKQRRKKSPFRLFVLCPSRCRLPTKPCCLLQEIFQFDLLAARFVTDRLPCMESAGDVTGGRWRKRRQKRRLVFTTARVLTYRLSVSVQSRVSLRTNGVARLKIMLSARSIVPVDLLHKCRLLSRLRSSVHTPVVLFCHVTCGLLV